MKTMYEALNEAADLLDKGWTTEAFARDKDGEPVSTISEAAVSFCLSGAVERVTWGQMTPEGSLRIQMYRAVCAVVPGESLLEWNDRQAKIGEPAALLRKLADDRYRAHVERYKVET